MKKRAQKFCKIQCFQFCNQINLYSETEYSLSKNNSEDILINIIPTARLNIRYIETFQTGINDFIYELGGTVGLWFGLSPVSLFDILLSQMYWFTKFINLFIHFIMKSLAVLHRGVCRVWSLLKRYLRNNLLKIKVKILGQPQLS
jgi:hypothetical protein